MFATCKKLKQIAILNKLEKYGVGILYVATILGICFSFFGSVLNSKMLSKELFGDWKYLQNYLTMLSFFINFGLYYSGGRLIAATNDKKRIGVLKGYMIYMSVAGLIVMLLATLIIGFFWHRFLSSSLFHLSLIIFPLFIVHPLMFYLETIFQSERKMLSFAIYRALPPLLYCSCLYIFKSYFTNNIFLSAFLYYATYFIVFALFILSDKYTFKRKSQEFDELKSENKSYGIHLYYGSLWGVGVGYLLPLLIGYFNINNSEVGNFSLALSFIIPFTFLPAIIGTSYFKQFVHLEKIPAEAFKKVVYSSLILLVGTLLFIDFFINLFLGAKYADVGFLVKIGAGGAILHGLGDFTNKFLSAKGEAKEIKKVAIIVGVTQVVASLVFIKYFSSIGAMIARSIGSTVYFVFLYFYYTKKYVWSKKIIVNKIDPVSI